MAIFSKNQYLIEKSSLTKRRTHSKLKKRISSTLDYSSLKLTRKDRQKIPPKYFLGVVVSSLIYSKIPSELEDLVLFVDGEWQTNKKKSAREIISNVCSLDKNSINLITGARLDKTYLIVNYADELAHYLFRNPNNSSFDSHQVKLIF